MTTRYWGMSLIGGGLIGSILAYWQGFTLVSTCLLFFGLSWVMTGVTLWLRPYCQANWSLTAVTGIASVCMAEAFIRWNETLLVQQIVLEIALIFLSAYPGILYLNLRQKEIWFSNEVANEDFYPDYRLLTLGLRIRFATYRELAILVCNLFLEYGRSFADWIYHFELANWTRKTPKC